MTFSKFFKDGFICYETVIKFIKFVKQVSLLVIHICYTMFDIIRLRSLFSYCWFSKIRREVLN